MAVYSWSCESKERGVGLLPVQIGYWCDSTANESEEVEVEIEVGLYLAAVADTPGVN